MRLEPNEDELQFNLTLVHFYECEKLAANVLACLVIRLITLTENVVASIALRNHCRVNRRGIEGRQIERVDGLLAYLGRLRAINTHE